MEAIKMNTGVNYKLFYEILLNLREIFYSYGRLDDSNSKLDEIVKMLFLSYYYANNGKKLTLSLTKEIAFERYSDASLVAPALRDMFEEAANYPLFRNSDGTSIFGANPTLNIQPTENLFAERIVSEIEKIDFVNLLHETNRENFDVLNECFGHFVRENFRNNKEDAQYMTPAEIAMPIVEMVYHDFINENYFDKFDPAEFKIMDPTCGVGTLLIESAKKHLAYIDSLNIQEHEKEVKKKSFLENGIIGQDKVDRMVRFSKINTLLIDGNYNNITIGNSISEKSSIDDWHNAIDFIFTNPPFGAEYKYSEIPVQNFPYLSLINCFGQTISSELLMLLKSLSLLKDGGKLVIVLPDSVFSAHGLNTPVRKILFTYFTINAVIEMPAVTFAQAGTRTKTSILYLTKKSPKPEAKIVMGKCDNIGFIVKERMGVPIKIKAGCNEVEDISRIYCSCHFQSSNKILSKKPSITNILLKDLIDGILNPSFYSAERLEILETLEIQKKDGYEIRSLSDIVRFETIGRKNKNVSDKTKHISVLHINPDSTIDFQQVLSFNPISKGRQCYTNDILFSKINPRIPRTTVIPELNQDLVCSNEFEILRPCAELGEYVICFLLKTSYVLKQIEHLTSGTSSSHSRIKREQLAGIKIPYPVSVEAKQEMNSINELIKTAFKNKYDADSILRAQLVKLETI